MPWDQIGKLVSESDSVQVTQVGVYPPAGESISESHIDIRPYQLWLQMFSTQSYDSPIVIVNSNGNKIFEIDSEGKPIIRSPNETRYRILVANDGTLSTEVVT